MKIGVLIDRLNVGGVEKIAIEEVRALIEAGHDAHLVVLRRKAVVENAFPDLLKDVPVIYLDERLPSIFRFSFVFPLFFFFSLFHLTYPLLLPFKVKRNEFDYLIVHGTYTIFTAIQLKKRRQIPFSGFVWDPASYLMQRVYKPKIPHLVYTVLLPIARTLDKHVIRAMNSVLVGGTAHNSFIKQADPDAKIDVVYPSVHPTQRPANKDEYVFVMTAWKEGKHPEYLIELAKNLPSLRIKMGGKWIDPDYRARFETMLKEAKVTSSIEVLGSLDEQELARLYRKALVVLQTNDDRGFGMPALEAAAQGTTFIIPKGQGVCDLFTDGVHGFYTKEKDTKTIVKKLQALISNPKMAGEMGKKALKEVKAHYSWKIHAQQLVDIIQRNCAKQ